MEIKPDQFKDSYDIIIAGFGPVGQFCSNYLSKDGLNIGVVESNLDVVPEPRAVSIDDEVQRSIFDLGLWKDLKDELLIPDFADLTFPSGKIILRGPVTSTSNGFPYVVTFYQPDLENLLRRNISEGSNTDIFSGHEIINFKEDNEIIELSLKNLQSNKLLRLRTKYLLACDGSNSFIRNKLKIKLIDLKYNKEWIIFDIAIKDFDKVEKVARYICDPKRPTIFNVLPGNRVRFEFQLLAGESRSEIINDHNLNASMSELLGYENYFIKRTYVYRYRGNYVSKFRSGNIFFLGDAAHQLPPFAGQGLSCGIKDATNLCWKISNVICNRFNKKILDTYEIERLDEVKNSIDSSVALGRLIDSLSIAFKKNNPLEEAIPPEAREQAYGKKSLTDKSISDGLFSSLAKESNIGKLLPFAAFDEDHDGIYNHSYKFMIISSKEPKDLLNKTTLKLLETFDVILINVSSLTIHNSTFQELIDLGDIIVRPDKAIYGIATGKITLQKLVDELLDHLIK